VRVNRRRGSPKLEDVTLRSITAPDLSFLKPLTHLWSLDIKLGGTTDLSAIAGMSSIKYLELWQIRGLPNVNVISGLYGLQNLFLQSLPQVEALPPLDDLHHLRRVVLENLKGLTDVESLRTAPSLEEFAFIDAGGKEPGIFLPVLQNPAVRRVSVGFGSMKKNAEFDGLCSEHGRQLALTRRFDYR
jgi:hypothetical protein